MRLKLLDLFSGIGGMSLGLEKSGAFKTVAFCECEPFARSILKKHWPDIPCYDDVQTLSAARLEADAIGVDALCGGFPCQDISVSGTGQGIDGARSGLWREFARLIGELRPRVAIVENTPALLANGMGRVLGELSALGYDAEWHCIPLAALGAPHERDRLWIVAYPAGQRHEADPGALWGAWAARILADIDVSGCEKQRRHVAAFTQYAAVERCRQWAAEPDVGRVVHGLPNRVDRLRCLGNVGAVQTCELIGLSIGRSPEFRAMMESRA